MAESPMYQTLLGPAFDRLHPAIQAFHSLQGTSVLEGWVRTEKPDSFLGWLLARCIGTPLTAAEGQIRFELHADPTTETWLRLFPADVMRSTLALKDGGLTEHLGLARLWFDLAEADGRLSMRLVRMTFLGIACPHWARPTIVAEETGSSEQLHFTVRASLPFIGQVTGYQGFLLLPTAAGRE
jgi:hypothetical protein